MSRDRGFVLVNALVLVAALSAAAVFLLARAEGARQQRAAGQEAARLALGLDAFETLALTRLAADGAGGADHPGEAWAEPFEALPLEGPGMAGRVSGRIEDMQGRFNLNWLTDPGDTLARAAFDRLALSLGVAPQGVEAIAGFLRPGGPENRAVFALLDPPVDPPGGPLLMVAQLEGLPGLDPRDLERLRPEVTALTADSTLNVNTASRAVLSAFLPGLTAARIDQILAVRKRAPFTSVAGFLVAAGGRAGDAGPGASDADGGGAGESPASATESPIPEERLSVGSRWFGAVFETDLEDRSARRSALFERRGPGEVPRVAWRLTVAP